MGPAVHHLRTICEEAARRNTVPGLVVAIGQAGRTVHVESFGARQLDPTHQPATADTVYDLASLTKAIGTSLLAVQAVAEGKLRLDDLVHRLVPAFRGERKDRVTIRDLLAHTSGLPAHRPMYRNVLADGTAPDRASASARIVTLAAEEPLEYEPTSRSLYSDLGFILLGAALEAALDGRLDRLMRERLFSPLGVPGLAFRPVDAELDPAGPPPVAPTERCAVRDRLVWGEVHDLNAFAMGGVAGHAGLFGQAPDVAVLASAVCKAWKSSRAGSASDVLDQETLRRFFQPAGVPGSTWRLGWDGPAATGSMAGDRIARTAVGHLGFTGCSLWIDPMREAFVVLLCNRVHPQVRDDPAFRQLRRAVQDAALDAIGYDPA